ncbi:MAG: hypothetical protein ACFFA7_16505 [Promethearchaeota archaeon]
MKRSNAIKGFLSLIMCSILFSNFLMIGHSNVVSIPNGLQVVHNLSSSVMPTHKSTLIFTRRSSEIMHITWRLGTPINDVGFWDSNTSTRIASNNQNFGVFNDTHDCFWIHTDISIDDSIIMCNIWKWVHTGNADTIFNVTGEGMHDTMDCWILKDSFGSEVWYEKQRGFLVNGTSKYSTDYHTYELVSAGVPSVPGFSYFLLISATVIVSIIIVEKRKIKK